jgi:opacity protein-like surface antigen
MPHSQLRARSLVAATAVGLAIGGFAMSASAQNAQPPSWYGGGSGSAVFLDNESGEPSYDTGYGLGVFGGYHFKNGFRTEAELGWQRSDLETDGQTDLFYGLANGYYDFDIGSRFVPYLGAGVGYGSINLDGTPSGLASVDDSDEVPLWQVSAGASYLLSDRMSLFGGYRYLSSFEDPSFTDSAGTTFDASYDAHIVQAGLRYNF